MTAGIERSKQMLCEMTPSSTSSLARPHSQWRAAASATAKGQKQRKIGGFPVVARLPWSARIQVRLGRALYPSAVVRPIPAISLAMAAASNDPSAGVTSF